MASAVAFVTNHRLEKEVMTSPTRSLRLLDFETHIFNVSCIAIICSSLFTCGIVEGGWYIDRYLACDFMIEYYSSHRISKISISYKYTILLT
jgi:hypothetical protein